MPTLGTTNGFVNKKQNSTVNHISVLHNAGLSDIISYINETSWRSSELLLAKGLRLFVKVLRIVAKTNCSNSK